MSTRLEADIGITMNKMFEEEIHTGREFFPEECHWCGKKIPKNCCFYASNHVYCESCYEQVSDDDDCYDTCDECGCYFKDPDGVEDEIIPYDYKGRQVCPACFLVLGNQKLDSFFIKHGVIKHGKARSKIKKEKI